MVGIFLCYIFYMKIKSKKKTLIFSLTLFVGLLFVFFPFLLIYLLKSNGVVESSDFQIVSFFILVILFLLVFTVEFLSMFLLADSTYHTFFIAASLLFFFIFSYVNVSKLYKLDFNIIAYLNTAFFYVLLFSIYHFLFYTYKVRFSKVLLIFAIPFLLCLICSFILISLEPKYAFIPLLVVVIDTVSSFIYFFIESKNVNYNFFPCLMITFLTLGVESTFLWSIYQQYYNEYIIIVYFSLIFICFSSIYLFFIVNSNKELAKYYKNKYELESQKNKILRNQISLHFIFNSLYYIQESYHEDINKGDESLQLFSKILRMNVDSMNKDLIPFEDELQNIFAYVEYVNYKTDKKFDVVFNISDSDFNVPPLSIVTFIENSLKYSKVNLKEDGFITISSYAKDDFFIIEIKDNGVGYDVNGQKSGSHGISNSIIRLNSIGATVSINSVINEGTVIEITIPKGDIK